MYTGLQPKGHLSWLMQRTYDLPLSKMPALFMGSILYIMLAAKLRSCSCIHKRYAKQLNHEKSVHDTGTQPMMCRDAHCSAGQDG